MTMFIDELQKEQQSIHKQLQQLEIKQTEILISQSNISLLQDKQQSIHKKIQQLEIKQTEILANSTSQSLISIYAMQLCKVSKKASEISIQDEQKTYKMNKKAYKVNKKAYDMNNKLSMTNYTSYMQLLYANWKKTGKSLCKQHPL